MDRDGRAWSALRAEFERAGCDAVPNGYEHDILEEAGLSPGARAEEVRRALVRVLVADPDAEAWVRRAVADADDHGEDLAAQLTEADCQALRAEWADAWAASATSALAMEELERRARERAREQEDQDPASGAGRQGEHDARR